MTLREYLRQDRRNGRALHLAQVHGWNIKTKLDIKWVYKKVRKNLFVRGSPACSPTTSLCGCVTYMKYALKNVPIMYGFFFVQIINSISSSSRCIVQYCLGQP